LVQSRLLITAGIGVIATILVYLGLEESLNRPSISNIPVPPDIVLKIVEKQFNISAQDSKNFKFNNVYVNPSGEVYQSDAEFNTIGSLLGKTEVTETGGSHYAWEIRDMANRKSFYVDHVTGQVISVNNDTRVS
jgi:predicted small secreted protein